jgi:hypothetical protein
MLDTGEYMEAIESQVTAPTAARDRLARVAILE